ncbi:GTP-binding protein [Methanolobus profundi]|uniref:CobW/HypB/UreG, nucleotide-binding domain n=1 Tax=Methanolobus profundi TaxID=487685 RepID=A0A1I4P9L8_9EURY|nr:GTP-binding protein [Methanolobus profundi]SFM24237.1 CobW/HypB/UreG, nucleotide-binding domain [Methanolobus profundi]
MKVSIIGGPTDSGKTTLILDLAKYLTSNGEKIGVIVQETGEVDYDEKTLSDLGISTKEVNSVCIPCSLDTDIRSNLLMLQEESSPDTVFIETEETVLPHKLKADLERMALPDTELLPAIVVVNSTEAETSSDQLIEYARKQLEGAEIICIDMIELDKKEHIADVRKMILELNTNAKVLECPVARDESFLKMLLE